MTTSSRQKFFINITKRTKGRVQEYSIWLSLNANIIKFKKVKSDDQQIRSNATIGSTGRSLIKKNHKRRRSSGCSSCWWSRTVCTCSIFVVVEDLLWICPFSHCHLRFAACGSCPLLESADVEAAAAELLWYWRRRLWRFPPRRLWSWWWRRWRSSSSSTSSLKDSAFTGAGGVGTTTLTVFSRWLRLENCLCCAGLTAAALSFTPFCLCSYRQN